MRSLPTAVCRLWRQYVPHGLPAAGPKYQLCHQCRTKGTLSGSHCSLLGQCQQKQPPQLLMTQVSQHLRRRSPFRQTGPHPRRRQRATPMTFRHHHPHHLKRVRHLTTKKKKKEHFDVVNAVTKEQTTASPAARGRSEYPSSASWVFGVCLCDCFAAAALAAEKFKRLFPPGVLSFMYSHWLFFLSTEIPPTGCHSMLLICPELPLNSRNGELVCRSHSTILLSHDPLMARTSSSSNLSTETVEVCFS